jgi:hypothetical protein
MWMNLSRNMRQDRPAFGTELVVDALLFVVCAATVFIYDLAWVVS